MGPGESSASPGNWKDTNLFKVTPAEEHNRGLEFRLFFRLMIHLGQMMLPFLSPPVTKGMLEKANSANFKDVPTLQQM